MVVTRILTWAITSRINALHVSFRFRAHLHVEPPRRTDDVTVRFGLHRLSGAEHSCVLTESWGNIVHVLALS